MKRWIVYKEGEDSRLMTAEEIRAGLREGSIDPFDQVSQEGSPIKNSLLEVDEIFREDEVSESPSQASGPSDTVLEAKTVHSKYEGPKGEDSGKKVPRRRSNTETKPRGKEKLEKELEPTSEPELKEPKPEDSPPPKTMKFHEDSSPKKRSGGNVSKSTGRKKDKKYILIDSKQGQLGPLDEEEIASLYKRGVIAKSVKVTRLGASGKKVPIRQFLATYSGEQIKHMVKGKRGQTRIKYPSSKTLNKLYRAVSGQKMVKKSSLTPGLAATVVAILAGILLYLVFDRSSQTSPQSNKSLSAQQDSRNSKSRNQARASSQQQDRKKSSPKQATAKKQNTKSNKRLATKKAQRSAGRSDKASKRRKSGPVARAYPLAGKTLAIGPLYYSRAELRSCSNKCSLNFRDAQGGNIKAVFFKAAFYDQLFRRSKGVTLVGRTRLQGNRLVIFVQDIR